MMRIALTGSIGMGKSTVARLFAAAGIPVFDADAVVRDLQGPSGSLVDRIGERFAGTVKAGVLDRDKLAQLVLEDPRLLVELETIVHPAVRQARQAFIDSNRDAPALLFEIPLLFETNGEGEFDKVITVSAPAEIQRDRVLARPGMTEVRLSSIVSRQLPDEDKRRRADFVVNTGADMSTTQAQVGHIIACLGLGAGE